MRNPLDPGRNRSGLLPPVRQHPSEGVPPYSSAVQKEADSHARLLVHTGDYDGQKAAKIIFDLLALLSKAEQELELEKKRYAAKTYSYHETVKRADAAEREIERLRDVVARYDEEARLRKERARGIDPDEIGFA